MRGLSFYHPATYFSLAYFQSPLIKPISSHLCRHFWLRYLHQWHPQSKGRGRLCPQQLGGFDCKKHKNHRYAGRLCQRRRVLQIALLHSFRFVYLFNDKTAWIALICAKSCNGKSLLDSPRISLNSYNNIFCLAKSHTLDADRRIATHSDIAYKNLLCCILHFLPFWCQK